MVPIKYCRRTFLKASAFSALRSTSKLGIARVDAMNAEKRSPMSTNFIVEDLLSQAGGDDCLDNVLESD